MFWASTTQCAEHVLGKVVSGSAGSLSSGSSHTSRKAHWPLPQPWGSFSCSLLFPSIQSMDGEKLGTSTRVSQLWGRGVGRKGTEWPHDALLTMAICHSSIRSLDSAYGPKLLSPSPTAQEVLGQPLGTCWGILDLALAICLKHPSGLSWEVPVSYCLLQCALVYNGYPQKPVLPFCLSHQHRPDCWRPAQRTTGGQVYTEMKQPN